MNNKKVLIIEDSETSSLLLEELFLKEGYSVSLTKTGEDGLKKVKSFSPDVVVVDTVLPGIDGFKVCKSIKDIKEPITPKVIMITGSFDAIDAVKARVYGVDDYCPKGSDLSCIVEAVKKLI